jgi:Actinobacteria/chloroflexi VLRF1 release factor
VTRGTGPGGAGGRWVEVGPERIVRWVESFGQRHGHTVAEPSPPCAPAAVLLRAEDGAAAECHPPFPPLRQPGEPATPMDWAALMAAHAGADRTVGVLLARLGGYAAGVFAGDPPALVASKTGARPVHGRSAAGGWSQQRFARRREKQAAEAMAAAADAAAAVLLPCAGRLDAVVLGGDRRAAAALRDDPRLRPVLGLATGRFLTVPDPRLAVLRDTPRLFRAVRIHLTGPA